jgi:hypothetical protein
MGYLGLAGLKTIAELTKFRYLPDLGKIFVNEEFVKNEILKLK